MSFYSIYRIVKDITRTIFGHRFWRKLLIVCLIAFGIWFFMHSKGYCTENTNDINYELYEYYETVTNDLISRLGRIYIFNPTANIFTEIKSNINYGFYFYYGSSQDGSDYNGTRPLNKTNINIIMYQNRGAFTKTQTSYDYANIYNQMQYQFTTDSSGNNGVFYYSLQQGFSTEKQAISTWYMPLKLYSYKTTNWLDFETALRNNDTQAILDLLEDIKTSTDNIEEALTSEDYNENDVTIGSTAIDNVTASTDGMFTTIFTNFNNAVSGGVSELVIPLPHTNETITIPSDIVSSHLGNFAYLVQAFWMYVFGLYTWRFVNNLIHRIKDGSILDGFKSDGEVITNTML